MTSSLESIHVLPLGVSAKAERAGQVERKIPPPRGSHQPQRKALRNGLRKAWPAGVEGTPPPRPSTCATPSGAWDVSGACCSQDHLFSPSAPALSQAWRLLIYTQDRTLWLWVGICPSLLAFLAAPRLWAGDTSVCSLRAQTDA